jgi:hypothetical protein
MTKALTHKLLCGGCDALYVSDFRKWQFKVGLTYVLPANTLVLMFPMGFVV